METIHRPLQLEGTGLPEGSAVSFRSLKSSQMEKSERPSTSPIRANCEARLLQTQQLMISQLYWKTVFRVAKTIIP
ncbi:MAG: hypothetical protein AAFY25_07775 [Pseudomonadota bacterium]